MWSCITISILEYIPILPVNEHFGKLRNIPQFFNKMWEFENEKKNKKRTDADPLTSFRPISHWPDDLDPTTPLVTPQTPLYLEPMIHSHFAEKDLKGREDGSSLFWKVKNKNCVVFKETLLLSSWVRLCVCCDVVTEIDGPLIIIKILNREEDSM